MRQLFVMIGLSLSLASSVSGGLIQHFVGSAAPGQFADVSNVLDNVGIGQSNQVSEVTSASFTLPGLPGETADLTFKFIRDTGNFQFTFGFFPVSAVEGIDPVGSKQAWATAAISSSMPVFDDRMVDPGAMNTVTGVLAAKEYGFYLLPNQTPVEFLADPASFYSAGFDRRSPLFSNEAGNPGELDQMLSFIGNGVTLFAFEDLTRTGVSDEDFTDLVFTVDVEFNCASNVPEPGSMIVWAGMMASCIVGRRRRIGNRGKTFTVRQRQAPNRRSTC